MNKLRGILWLVVAFLVTGCSTQTPEPVSLSSLTWSELSETPEYKQWLGTDNCRMESLDRVLNLTDMPIKQSDKVGPTPKEVMKTRTKRLQTAMQDESSRLKLLSEVASWDSWTSSTNEELMQIWTTPDEILRSIDLWVTDRANLAINELSTKTFASSVRDKIKSDWEKKCGNESLLAEVRQTISDYKTALETLTAKVVSDFEKKGYTNFDDKILIKRLGVKIVGGERKFAYSAVQFAYCDTGHLKMADSIDFDFPGVLVDADGIKESDWSIRADAEYGVSEPELGVVRMYYLNLNSEALKEFEKSHDSSGLPVNSVSCR